MKALNRNKGFTLAELLIVMAIVVVLASIAIPTFGKQLETARETSDVEALRAEFEDVFTSAYFDYANTQTWKHGTSIGDDDTIEANTSTGQPAILKGDGVYVSGKVLMTQTTDLKDSSNNVLGGFEYVSPKFNVNGADVPLRYATNMTAIAGKPVTVTFYFRPGATGAESEISLVDAVVTAIT